MKKLLRSLLLLSALVFLEAQKNGGLAAATSASASATGKSSRPGGSTDAQTAVHLSYPANLLSMAGKTLQPADPSLPLKSAVVLVAAPDGNGIIYVTPTGSGTKTGENWGNAMADLQQAIETENVAQVWVAGGTYKPQPKAGSGTTNRDRAFVLKANVKIYGSFAGNELTLDSRTPAVMMSNPSILTGELGGAGKGDNANHVVICVGNVGSAELNGFKITGGYADGVSEEIMVNGQNINTYCGGGIYVYISSPKLTNLQIIDNASPSGVGGGVMIQAHNDASGFTPANPILTNVVISGNTSGQGGGIANYDNSGPILTNVLITGNIATTEGGGMYNLIAGPVMTNVTISGNNAPSGGAIQNQQYSSPWIRNSIIYGNSSGIEQASGDASSIRRQYSLIQGLPGDEAGAGNGNLDGTALRPEFVHAPAASLAPFSDGDYHLKNGSRGIDEASNAYFASGANPDLQAITTDIEGLPRMAGTSVDMGTYEFQGASLPVALTLYTAQVTGQRVQVKWTTATEINNKEFLLTRSVDGENFVALAKITGAGNSDQPKDYTYYDTDPFAGLNYYRLQQVSLNGSITDYGIKTIDFARADSHVKLYPNPASDYIMVDLIKAGQLQLYSVAGSLVKTQTVKPGINRIDIKTLSAGIYFCRIGDINLKFVKK